MRAMPGVAEIRRKTSAGRSSRPPRSPQVRQLAPRALSKKPSKRPSPAAEEAHRIGRTPGSYKTENSTQKSARAADNLNPSSSATSSKWAPQEVDSVVSISVSPQEA